MARFVVMERAGRVPAAERLAEARIVRDGFHILGLLFPPLWLLWHGLLIEAVLAFAVLFGIAAAGELMGLGPAASLLSLIVSLYVGLEGSALRVAALRRRGWRVWDVVEADDVADAEIRVAHAMADAGPADPYPMNASGVALPWSRHSPAPALGLLGYSGRS